MARCRFFQKMNEQIWFFVVTTFHGKKTSSFVHFLGESTVRQSAYGFIRPLVTEVMLFYTPICVLKIVRSKCHFLLSSYFYWKKVKSKTLLCRCQQGVEFPLLGSHNALFTNFRPVDIYWHYLGFLHLTYSKLEGKFETAVTLAFHVKYSVKEFLSFHIIFDFKETLNKLI